MPAAPNVTELAWQPLTETDLPVRTALAAECLAADGGLPLAADPGFLRERYLAAGGIAGFDGAEAGCGRRPPSASARAGRQS